MKAKKKNTMLSVKQLAALLAISESTVKKLARSKELPCVYKNRRPRFTLERLLALFSKWEGGAAC